MALLLPTTNKTQIVRLTKALFDAAPGYTYLSAFEGAVAEMGAGAAGMNAFANWLSSVVSTNPATLTATMVQSLHLTGATATAFTTFFNAAFASVTPAQYGQTILAGLNGLAAIPGTDNTWGATATAFNTSVANAYVFSTNTANTTVDIATLMAADEPNTTLTTSPLDKLFGTAGVDNFYAYIRDNANTLQSGDYINGDAGIDILWADMGTSSNFAVTPETVSVEEIRIRGEAVPGDSNNGNNINTANQNVNIDAQRMAGVTTWASDNSRSDVIIEDVRINSNVSTIEWKESDPGDVDFGVYFNQRNLVNTLGGSSSLNIMVMDTYAAGTAGTAATPLLALNFNAYSYYATATGGTATLITLGGAGTAAGTAMLAAKTYTAMKDAFTLALKTANVGGTVVDLSASVTVGLGALTNFTTLAAASTTSAPVAASFLNLSGQVITLSTSQPGITISTTGAPGSPAAGWIAAGPAPITGSIVQTYTTGTSDSAALVNTNIILDDVGMYSTGGDLVVGGMSTGETSTSKGVERFNIEVRDNSKLQTINSTDNTLREVVIVNGTTSGEKSAYVTFTKDAGDLTVNGVVGTAGAGITNNNAPLAGTSTTYTNPTTTGAAGDTAIQGHSDTGAAGFTDVRLIDASAMRGKFAFTAAITSDTIAKYVPLTDTQPVPTDDVATENIVGLGANFVYKGGTNNDTMVVTIDGGVAGSQSQKIIGQSDFTFNIAGNAGDDNITVTLVDTANNGGALNWYTNQNYNNNITITGGDGADTIRIPGAGDTTIDAGAGNDVIYTDNTGRTTIAATTGSVLPVIGITKSNAIWVFNTADQDAASGNWARNINDLRSDSNGSNTLYKATLTVTFLGTNGLTTSTAVTLPANTNYKVSDLEINQAIKKAINDDLVLNKLLLASDGPANTLVVQSLIDGAMTTTDLQVAITAPTTLTAEEITGIGGVGSTLAAVQTIINTAATALTVTAGGSYVSAFATDGAAVPVPISGDASTSTSDNFVTLGAGNDIIVLGTTVDAGGTKGLSSNEVIQFAGTFGNDVIVNYTAAGAGMDYLNLSTPFLGGAALAINVDGALAATDKRVNIILETAANDTADEIKALFNNLTQTATTQKQVYIAYTTSNVGKVYSVVDGTGAADVVVTKEGEIDLADVAWTSLNSINNFIAPSVTADGIQTTGITVAAVNGVTPQVLTGTPLNDTLTGVAEVTAPDTIAYNGLAGNDTYIGSATAGVVETFNATAGVKTITGFTTNDIVVVSAGAIASITTDAVAGSWAAAATSTNAGTLNITMGAAGQTLNLNLLGGTVGAVVTGNAGANTFVGSAFADTFTGGALVDNVTGGAGADILDGGAGVADIVSYADVTLATSHSLANISGMAINLSAVAVTAATIATAMGGTVVIGGGAGVAGADLAAGTAGYLATAAANSTATMVRDTLTGFEVVVGSSLADFIVGSAGNDTITGGAGADRLTGGTGNDTFAYATRALDGVVAAGAATNLSTVDSIFDFVGNAGAAGDSIQLGLGANAWGGAITFTGATTATVTAITVALTGLANWTAVTAALQAATAGTASTAGAAQIYDITLTAGGVGDFNGGVAMRTVIINDDTAAIAATDSVINLTGITGALNAQDFVFA